jgi:hypothetical protein
VTQVIGGVTQKTRRVRLRLRLFDLVFDRMRK